MEVVPLRPQLDCYDIARALRNIADDIEADNYDFTPNLAVLVLAAEVETHGREDVTVGFDWQTHELGKAGFFASKGLLACAIGSFETSQG